MSCRRIFRFPYRNRGSCAAPKSGVTCHPITAGAAGTARHTRRRRVNAKTAPRAAGSRAASAPSTAAAPAGADLGRGKHGAHHQPRDGDGLEPRHQANRMDVEAVTDEDDIDSDARRVRLSRARSVTSTALLRVLAPSPSPRAGRTSRRPLSPPQLRDRSAGESLSA